MVQELLPSNRFIVILLLVILSSSSVFSQSVLLPADIVIVTVNSSEDSFDFIPLVQLKAGTSIWFSNGTWDSQSFSIIGDEIEVKIIQSIDAGTNVHVNEREDSRVQVNGKLSFTGNGDRLIAYQKDEGITRVLFGIGWGNNDIWNEESAIGSKIPESISKENNSLLQLGLHQNYQYYLRNGASGTPSMLSKFVADASKWRGQDDKEFPFFGTAFRILKPPVILFDESISTIQEGEPILLNAAIYEHDGSRLTVDVAFNTQNSIADTSDMQGFTKYTFNFTGLIGDAIYAIEIPTENNENYEGTENAFFELQNLSKGSLGDFVTHVAFIQDNDLPSIAISEIYYTGNPITDYIDIQNNESVNVDLSGWQLISRNLVHEFDYGTRIPAFQTLRITHPKFRSNQIDGEKPWLTRNSGTLELKNPKGVLVSNLKYRIQEENRDIISRNEIRPTELRNSSIAASKISSNRTMELSESQIQEMTDKNGWYVVHKDLYSQEVIEMESFVWNEEENTFEIFDEFKDVQLYNIPRVSYLTKEQISDNQLAKDTTTSNEFLEEEFSFQISATDMDGNGIINRSEGFNFLNNYTNNSILVKDLHSIIAREVGLGKIYPYVYLWKNDGQGWMSASILKENDLIPANSSFWIKADSIFSPVDISLYVAPNYNRELVEEEQKLAESSLGLSIGTGKLKKNISIELFEEGREIPRDLITPELENELKVMGDEFLYFGAKNGFNWNSRISLERIENQKTVLPLNFESSETGTLTFEVSEWRNIPSDWSIILEDLELDKNYELNQNWTFEIDYLSKKYEKENSNMEERSLVREVDEEESLRFNLVILPPGVEETEPLIPEEISLGQNYPNPFNPTTTIAFYLPEAVPVKLSVFNVVGQPVAVLTEGTLSQGDHEFEWDASGLPSGMYIYQLEVGNKILTQKMTLVK
ncbi:MAG: T9SS type A sorting domain-containing protein [Balneolaceae bacterium]